MAWVKDVGEFLPDAYVPETTPQDRNIVIPSDRIFPESYLYPVTPIFKPDGNITIP